MEQAGSATAGALGGSFADMPCLRRASVPWCCSLAFSWEPGRHRIWGLTLHGGA